MTRPTTDWSLNNDGIKWVEGLMRPSVVEGFQRIETIEHDHITRGPIVFLETIKA